MFSSIRSRLWLSYAALIIAALAIVTVVLLLFLLRNPLVYRQTYVRLQAAQGLLVGRAADTARSAAVAQALNVRVLIFGADGSLLEDTGTTTLNIRPVLLNGRSLGTVRDPSGKAWLYSQTRLGNGSALVVAAPRPKLLPVLGLLTDELFWPVLEGGLIALLLALVLAYALARWIADPLQRLMTDVRSVSPDGAIARTRGPIDQKADNSLAGRSPVAQGGPQEVQELSTALRSMMARVEASQKSQRDFVANVSHELKTPLTSIQGFAQALLDGAAETPEARRQAAEVIFTEAGRMHRMAVDLLDLARLDAGIADLRMGELNLAQVLEGVVQKLRPQAASAGVQLQSALPADLPALVGDADRMAQVFINLADNALKFTPAGGTIFVEARREATEIQVYVRDTGPGIALQDIPHVFDRFYQSDAARGGGEKHGAGLGLAIAQEIVRAHSGRITVRSAKGRGAEFVVHLPLFSREMD